MALPPGARLGPYEITSQLGAGGMGEVYRARDTRLERTVAIKVLPADVSQDSDLRARFEREARAIAALDHPHICAIYDVGEADATLYLVMQYLEGETLGARLARVKGPLPLDQVMRIAVEIADALDKAHRAGITHRDLKPANIMLTKTGGAKLLDFGLAKLRGPAGPISMSGMTRLATATPNTAHGTILGTVPYMAPEQLEGRDADGRSDIWALGSVIYEMATGQRPFDGASPASIIGSILKDTPPPISSRQPLSPLTLDHIVGRCLEKGPDERWQTAADLMRELRWADASRASVALSQPPLRRDPRSGWIAAAICAAGMIVLAVALMLGSREAPRLAPLVKFAITLPANAMFSSPPATLPSTQLAVSPDGRWVAFVAESIGHEAMLWIRPIDGTTAQALAGTDAAAYPFWAPDSHAVAFFAHGQLKRIDVPAGAPQTVCEAIDPRGGAWSRDNVIVFGLNQTGLLRVSASGGQPAAVTKLAAMDTGHRWPSFLPDGRHIVYFARGRSTQDSSVNVASLDAAETTRLFAAQSMASYVSTGHLLFVTNGMLVAQPFEPATRSLTGEPTTIAHEVAHSSVNSASYSASDTGLLAFAAPAVSQTQLAWFDRGGTLISRVGEPRDYADVQLFGDDRRALVTRLEAKTAGGNIWVVDVATSASSPLTFDASVSAQPVCSPDCGEIVFRSNREIPAPLFRRLASGAGGEELLLRADGVLRLAGNLFPSAWSPDGRFILFHTAFAATGYDVWVLPMTGERQPRPFVQTRGADMHARFSPNGRFVAYSSDESGRAQVYVQLFPSAEGRWQLSTEGGAEPRWSSDGRELFFVGADRRLMSVPVNTDASFEHRPPVPLFSTRIANFANPFRTSYAASRDGQRFLINGAAENAVASSITVVLNWPALLKKESAVR